MGVRAARGLVLVVDDDVDIRETISMILEDEGYTVACAANGREALDYLREQAVHGPPPNLILLDLMMPIMDGAEFCTHQRRDSRLADIPVVIVTASGQAKEHAAALNARALLYKPLALDTLLEKVEQCCSQVESRQAMAPDPAPEPEVFTRKPREREGEREN